MYGRNSKNASSFPRVPRPEPAITPVNSNVYHCRRGHRAGLPMLQKNKEQKSLRMLPDDVIWAIHCGEHMSSPAGRMRPCWEKMCRNAGSRRWCNGCIPLVGLTGFPTISVREGYEPGSRKFSPTETSFCYVLETGSRVL